MMRTFPLLLSLASLLATAGCPTSTKVDTGSGDTSSSGVDGDNDGYSSEDDCDDSNPAINEGATEICDGLDNDCDTEIDEGVTSTYYMDADNDGFGDTNVSATACDKPDGYVPTGNDCDDTNPQVYPGNVEICDGADNNCDGQTDEGVGTVWYEDADTDGFGNADSSVYECTQPAGYVTDATDCDDTKASANPEETEICDEIDNDCDGDTDEGVTRTYYADTDGDGWGDISSTTGACSLPTGYAIEPGDCDDDNGAINPDAIEYCDSLDNDCDGEVDEDTSDALVFYRDFDGDGYGDAASTTTGCVPPTGYVTDSTDCNDRVAAINPGEDEVCNGKDDDCDDEVDESDAVDASTWYQDLDSDGYGNGSVTALACEEPRGYVADASDCDDTHADAYPGAPEYCDGYDNDCNGDVDEEDAVDVSTWYRDSDRDGWGGTITEETCSPSTGFVEDSGDCNDRDAAINPAATEICDGTDNDCDGTTDEGDAEDALTWYRDADGDGYGNEDVSTTACSMPTGFVADRTDCDDTLSSSFPGATELCNGVDDNCDGNVDEATAADAGTWYKDRDEDGYGDTSTSTVSCTTPDGYVGTSGDCNDLNTSINPAATEICDSVDNDCDGTVDEADASGAATWYQDSDGDGYGNLGSTATGCAPPTGYISNSTDCDDSTAAVNPGASELCNGVDDNCNGVTDESTATDAPTWYQDADSDGFGNAAVTTRACSMPSGYVSNSTDCSDSASTVYPGATETCNGVDDDCDGTVDEGAVGSLTWYQDADADGYGNAASTTSSCTMPSGYVADATDCDDTLANVSPADTEVCDGLDNDCDGTVDDAPSDGDTYYADDDGDMLGDPRSTTVACSTPSGYVENTYDCNDADATEPVVADVDRGSAGGDGTYLNPLDSIQDAILLASECVIAYPGTYYENIDFSGRNISVTGVEGSASTVVDASGLAGPVVTFATNETMVATLSGFTLTGGSGYSEMTSESYMCTSVLTCYIHTTTYCGGGIYMEGADPTLSDLVITENDLPPYSTTTTGYDTYTTLSYGGGLCYVDSGATLTDFQIYDNYASQGGGMFIDGTSAPELKEGWVNTNASDDGAGAYVEGELGYTNIVSIYNSAVSEGGGVLLVDGSLNEVNVTHGSEDAANGGSIYASGASYAFVMNSIIYGSPSAEGVLVDGSSSFSGSYNNAYGNMGGNYSGVTDPTGGSGNISANPLFTTVGTNEWILGSGSPSINTGNPASAYNDADGSRNDQGAFGGNRSTWAL